MSEVLSLRLSRLKTPIGEMLIAEDCEGNLRSVDWLDDETRMQELLRLHYGKDRFRLETACAPTESVHALDRYFQGDLAAIDSLPVKTAGTPFQREVWGALRSIACGTTITYGALAQRIGRPSSSRAVGLANGANLVGVVLPCHRVIGSDGSLTGYGGGIDRKLWLLKHEKGAHLSRTLAGQNQIRSMPA
jgi:methylated-DNA-[protein]-cysteine S-methyltransferase